MVARNQVTFIGRLGTAEEWSTRLSFGGVSPGPGPYSTEAELAAWAVDGGDGVEAIFSTPGNIFQTLLSSEGTVDTLRFDYINAVDVVEASAEYVMNFTGSNAPTFPYQTSVVVSLLTGLPGASRRGRSYLPHLTGALTPPGAQVGAQRRTDIATMWRNVVSALELGQPDAGRVECGVASTSLNVVTPVTSYSVGSILDTQRRRRNGLIETYTTVSA